MVFSDKKQMKAIQVSLNLRAVVGGRMVRASVDAQAHEGDRIKEVTGRLMKTVEPAVTEYTSGVKMVDIDKSSDSTESQPE